MYYCTTPVLNSRVLLMYTDTVKELPGYPVRNSPSGGFLLWGGALGSEGVVYDIAWRRCPRRTPWMMLRTPVCSYPIIVTHLSFNFLCLLLLYSIYLNDPTLHRIYTANTVHNMSNVACTSTTHSLVFLSCNHLVYPMNPPPPPSVPCLYTWQSSAGAGWLRRDPLGVTLRTHSRSCDGGSTPSRRVGQAERGHAVRRCNQRAWGGVKIFQIREKAWDCSGGK